VPRFSFSVFSVSWSLPTACLQTQTPWSSSTSAPTGPQWTFIGLRDRVMLLLWRTIAFHCVTRGTFSGRICFRPTSRWMKSALGLRSRFVDLLICIIFPLTMFKTYFQALAIFSDHPKHTDETAGAPPSLRLALPYHRYARHALLRLFLYSGGSRSPILSPTSLIPSTASTGDGIGPNSLCSQPTLNVPMSYDSKYAASIASSRLFLTCSLAHYLSHPPHGCGNKVSISRR
jgi:hypothetical protein